MPHSQRRKTHTPTTVSPTPQSETKDTCTNHFVTNTSVTEMKDTCINHCVTNTSVTEMKDTCINHFVTNTLVTEIKDTCTKYCNHFVLFFIHIDSGEAHVKTWTFCQQGETQPNAVQYRFYAIEFITKIYIFKGISQLIFS